MSTFHEAQQKVNESLKAAWKWAKAPDDPAVRAERWKALWKIAKHRAKHGQKRVAWAARRKIYRRHFKQQQKAAAKGRKPEFKPYMANGCPYSGLNDRHRTIIAWAVTKYGQYITATTNGTHAPGSFHYVWRAVDGGAPMNAEGIASMKRFQNWLAEHYPASSEIFGPDSWYIKYGRRYAGAFPGHGNHWHEAE